MMWTTLAAPLAEQFRIVAVDLPGHGRSSSRPGRWTHRQAAHDVIAALDSLGLAQVAAVGPSSGGMTLLHLAGIDPGRISAMVLIGATTHFGPPARQFMASVRPPHAPLARMRVFHESDEQFLTLQHDFHACKDDDDDMALGAAELGRITARTLIVHGDRDALFPVPIAVGMYEGISDSALWVIPNAGHTPLFDVQASEVIAQTRAFLKREPASTGA